MSKPKILLIEPDVVLARSINSALSGSGYVVSACYTAQEAVNLADSVNFDLVISELLLVGHSGLEFLYEFRSYADWQRTPVIIFSIVPPTEFAGSRDGLFSQLGVSAYLYKPNTSLSQLMSCIESVLIHEPA